MLTVVLYYTNENNKINDIKYTYNRSYSKLFNIESSLVFENIIKKLNRNVEKKKIIRSFSFINIYTYFINTLIIFYNKDHVMNIINNLLTIEKQDIGVLTYYNKKMYSNFENISPEEIYLSSTDYWESDYMYYTEDENDDVLLIEKMCLRRSQRLNKIY
jgi:hypothetical protein